MLQVAQTWLAVTIRPGVKLEAPATYRFYVTEHPPASHDLIVDGESFEIKTQGNSPADVTITGDGGSYLLFAYGRHDPSGKVGSVDWTSWATPGCRNLSSSRSKVSNRYYLGARYPGFAVESVVPSKKGAVLEAPELYRCATILMSR